MFRHCAHQAAGLLALGDLHAVRLLAVVQHGDEQAELPFLWRLCLSLTELGQSVTVLDSTVAESSAAPGLQERLHTYDASSPPAGTWSVVPAKLGLMQLAMTNRRHQRGWHQLMQCFGGDGVLILYCPADGIASILNGLQVPTLLPISPQRASLLTSYLAFKRLFVESGLQPTIIDVRSADTAIGNSEAPAVCASLVECAKSFLHLEAQVVAFSEAFEDDRTANEFRSFVLSLLESASLQVIDSTTDLHTSKPVPTRDGRSHMFMRTVDVHR